MGRPYRNFILGASGQVYSCKCGHHLASTEDVISKSFHSRAGKAYLFERVINVHLAAKEERLMTTGLHWVRDMFCNGCDSLVGWQYIQAEEPSQQYKEGRFILERSKLQHMSEHSSTQRLHMASPSDGSDQDGC